MSYALDTDYAQETVESPVYWMAQDTTLSYYIAYVVFGDSYDGANDWSVLSCITDPLTLCASYPGPGTFDN